MILKHHLRLLYPIPEPEPKLSLSLIQPKSVAEPGPSPAPQRYLGWARCVAGDFALTLEGPG